MCSNKLTAQVFLASTQVFSLIRKAYVQTLLRAPQNKGWQSFFFEGMTVKFVHEKNWKNSVKVSMSQML